MRQRSFGDYLVGALMGCVGGLPLSGLSAWALAGLMGGSYAMWLAIVAMPAATVTMAGYLVSEDRSGTDKPWWS